ncbi:MAG TPA: TerB family tellurite resistance protein [Gammaproteobacteria bacterium]|nr:TerB family tellurite resistance protein [Gammaproteobacteria bacterium]
MLRKLAALFDGAFAGGADDPGVREHGLRVATALLLIEVAKADYAEELAEGEVLLSSLKQFFALDDAAAALLLEEARSTADRAVELQQFTRRLHEQLSVAEKQRIVEMLWQVALADSRLDKHEDHLVRRIAELLYVSHSDLIRIRNRVRSAT